MEEIINNLNKMLCDLAVFYRKLQNYHWNIEVKDFFIIHEKLEEYYDDLNQQIDELAEHILMLGYQPLGTLKDYIANTGIKEAKNEKIASKTIFENLIEDYTKLLQESNKIKELADKNNSYFTSSMMDNFISDYMKKLWMLKQSNKC